MDRHRPPVAWSLVLPVAAAELLLLVATANRYGYHRDELYFRVAARHPAWGYDDQPALTPLLGRLLGVAVRRRPARAAGGLGGRDRARRRARRADRAGARRGTRGTGGGRARDCRVRCGDGGRPSPLDDDVRRARLGDGRLPRGPASSAAGTSGSGCSSASSSASGSRTSTSCCSSSARSRAAASSTAAASLARSPWLWAGAALALALWLPNLLWQAQHGWPQLELADKIGDEDPIGNRVRAAAAAAAADRPAPRAALARRALVAPAPRRRPTVSPARARLPRPARDRARRPGRSRTTRWACCSRCSAPEASSPSTAARAGKTTRLALGARDRRLRRRRGCDHAPARARRATCTRRRSPPSTRTRSRRSAGPPSPRPSRGSGTGLPPAERANAVVYASNYGEAGAIARYGPALGIPRAYSGHNAFWRFGRPPRRRRARSSWSATATRAASAAPSAAAGARRRIDNGVDLDNEEQGAPVWTCAATVEPWSKLWPRLRHLDP